MANSCAVHNTKLMDEAALGQWILRRLGAPVWCVELTQDHINDAIKSAVDWFTAKKGAFKLGHFTLVSGQPMYCLPDEVEIILDLFFPAPESDISLIFSPYLLLDEKVPYDVFAAPQSVGLYSSYTHTLQYIETAKRVLSAEMDWEQRGRQVWITPVPKQVGKCIYEYKSCVFNIQQLPYRDHYLIKNYALAVAMRDLALIRGKFASFPTAQGDQSLNGDVLLSEANAMLEKLNEEIMLTGYPMKFTTG